MSFSKACRARARELMYRSVLLLFIGLAQPQSTQVIIAGRVLNSRTGQPLAAKVTYHNYQTGATGAAATDGRGFYSLPSLQPGTYSLRAECPDFQARELQARNIYVAARLEIDFTLRPLKEVLEAGDYNSALLPHDKVILPVLGPDLEAGRSAPLETTDVQSESRQPSLSYVINPEEISEAPLSARNVYSMAVTLPGVTAAQVTGRGLQISANGQRASASNYLLDGVQNNDFVNTGAFSAAAPEAIQEYRISTNNFSAEYGQTAGFVANAVTTRGGSSYHGLVYGYLDNEAVDANTFQNNLSTLPRNPFKRIYGGYSASGPILRERLFFSSAFEQLNSKSLRNPEEVVYFLPGQLRACLGASSSPILNLYDEFPLQNQIQATQYSTGGACGTFSDGFIRKPVTVKRTLALERLDLQSRDGTQHLMARVALSRASQPDYYYSIYKGLSEPLLRNTAGISVGYIKSFGPSIVNDVKFAWSPGLISTIRPHPEIPGLQVFTGSNSDQSFQVPSAGDALNFGMRGSQWEINDSLTWTHGRHVVVAGGGLLLRRPQYLLSYLDQGLYNFGYLGITADWTKFFAAGEPLYYELPLNRIGFRTDLAQGTLVPSPPAKYDQYSDNQWSGFVQESARLTRQLAINLGVRYESFGALRNDDGPQVFLEPASGQSIEERIAGATLQMEDRSAYRPARNNWAGRFGLSYNPWPKTVLRAGYGIFYDRPFDNLFLDARNQSVVPLPLGPQGVVAAFQMTQPMDPALTPAALFASGMNRPVLPYNVLPVISGGMESVYQEILTSDLRVVHSYPLELLWIDRNLRTPYVQSAFLSLQHQISSTLQIEVNQSLALGRKLISNDLVNRICSLDCTQTTGRLNPALPDILYRSNSGSSDYASLQVLARYRTGRAVFQAAYTDSHSIDNISDPMLSDVFNLAFTNLDTIGEARCCGTFSRQFDSRLDRGNSDFDIRHNLVFYSAWNSPGLTQNGWLRKITGNWTLAEMAGIRSGLPFTVLAPSVYAFSGEGLPVGARPNLIDPATVNISQAVPGGMQLVNLGSLSLPSNLQPGTLGRNAFQGPGFWNVDVSLMRSFALPRLGESGRIQLGASAFNAFNHSNLGLPDTSGLALYGADQNQTQFPAALPLFPSPRRIQLQVKVAF